MIFEMTTNLNKVLKKTQATLQEQALQHTIRVSSNFVDNIMSFDEVEVIPYYTKQGATISLSGDNLDTYLEEDTLLSQFITEQEQRITDELEAAAETILKGVLK